MLIYQKVIYDDVILIPVFDLNSMDQNVFFDGTILNPAWISSISEVSSSLWISESKSAAWWIHRKSNMGPINCHEVKIVIYIYNYIQWNITERKTLPWVFTKVENPDVSLFSYGFPMVFPPATSVPDFASTSVQKRLRHSPGRAAAWPEPRIATIATRIENEDIIWYIFFTASVRFS